MCSRNCSYVHICVLYVCLCIAYADYSVCIHRPPKHITDPNVYHDLFKEYGEIVFITICLDNGALLKVYTIVP
jgi:hypothetical protein